MLGTQALQGAHLNADQIGMKNPHQNIRRIGRIGEGPQDIEEGTNAQFFSDGRHILHGRVVVGSEHEAHPRLSNALCDLFGVQKETRPQTLQHIGAPALRTHAAVAVFAHPGSRGGGHEHRASRYIEGVRAVATRAHDVDQMRAVFHVHFGGELAHDLGRGRDLADGFFFHAQPSEECRTHQGRHLTRHDHAHQVQHLVVKNLSVLNRALNRLARGDGHGLDSQKNGLWQQGT